MTSASQTPLSLATPAVENVFSWGSCKAQKQELSMPRVSQHTSIDGSLQHGFHLQMSSLAASGLEGAWPGGSHCESGSAQKAFHCGSGH